MDSFRDQLLSARLRNDRSAALSAVAEVMNSSDYGYVVDCTLVCRDVFAAWPAFDWSQLRTKLAQMREETN